MALIGNYTLILKSPGRYLSGTLASGERSNWNTHGGMRNFLFGDPARYNSGVPNGYGQDGWIWPVTAGGMSSYTQSAGSTSVQLNLALGKDLSGQADGAGIGADALLALAVGLTGQADGVGQLGLANLAAALALLGQADGVGAATAFLQLIVDLVGLSDGQATASAIMAALAHLSGTTEEALELTADAVAAAVWAAIASQNDATGSMGKKINEIYKILGLDSGAPVTHTPTGISANGIDIDIAGDGETSSIVTRQ